MTLDISIHAPREGSDQAGEHVLVRTHISIHAPREGSDGPGCMGSFQGLNFYPRSPRGERPPP